jgi:aminopeptidase N
MNEKWKKLAVKTEIIQLTEDISIPVSGLSFKELGRLAQFQDSRDFEGAMDYLLYVTLRKSIPQDEMNEEELRVFLTQISGEKGAMVAKKVQELTGLSTPEKNG